jgi:DNA-binding NarL/FixJ family response regulator
VEAERGEVDRTLVLADDHPIVLDGLEQLFRLASDVRVVGRCRDGAEALRTTLEVRPDVLVLDVRMPGTDGLEVLRRLAGAGAATRVVLLTAALDDAQLLEAIELGACGLVLKEMAPERLVEAVRAVAEGGEWIYQGGVGRALRRMAGRHRAAQEVARVLTPRELEIVRMVARGLRNRAIAEQLHITEGTVKIHLHNIYQKLEADGRLELALYAQRQGLA